MTSASFVRELKDRTDIVELIAEHVQLRRAGRNFVGLCPFHQEKSPSFNVSRERQMYYCFGCKRHGDAITFLMDVQGFTFGESVRELAGRAGLEVPAEVGRSPRGDPEADARRERWRAVLSAAHQFYRRLLWDDRAGEPGRAYLAERGVSRELAEAFGLGFAPPAWDRLYSHLRAARHSPADMETMGLVVARAGGDGCYDRFRARLVFPVEDARGQTVAFSGRILPGLEVDARKDGPEAAKYINSPETPLYHKGRSFLGLVQARQAIRTARSVVLVEGNFDLLAVHALGRPDVLAPLGTALTPEQAGLLRRLGVEAVTLLLDPDAAGRAAARRNFPVLAASGFAVRWARLPEGRDPGSLLPGAEGDLLRECLESVPSFLERAVREAALAAGESPEGRAAAAREVAAFIAALPDPAERDAQVFSAAAAFGIARHAMYREVEASGSAVREEEPAPPPAAAGPEAPAAVAEPAFPEPEAALVAAVIAQPALAREAAAARIEESFSSAGLRRVLARLEASAIEGTVEEAVLAEELVAAAEGPALRAWVGGALMRAAELPPERAEQQFRRAVGAVRLEAERRHVRPLGGRIRAAQAGGDEGEALRLLEAKRRLVKGGVKKVIYGSGRPRRRRAAGGPRSLGCGGRSVGRGRGTVDRMVSGR